MNNIVIAHRLEVIDRKMDALIDLFTESINRERENINILKSAFSTVRDTVSFLREQQEAVLQNLEDID